MKITSKNTIKDWFGDGKMALGSDFSNININELIVALIEQMRLSSKLPEYLKIKDYISVNGVKRYGSIKPYAIKTDKNGYPHFLICIEGVWIWKSAKYFLVF